MVKIRLVVVVGLVIFSQNVMSAPLLHFKNGAIDPIQPTQQMKEFGFAFKGTFSSPKNARIFIIQFKNLIGPEQISLVETSGAKILRYLPDQAFIVNSDSSTAQNLTTNPLVRWVGPYSTAVRGTPSLLSWSLLTQDQNKRVTVAFFDTEDKADAMKMVEQRAQNVLFRSSSSLVIDITQKGLAEVAAIEGVEWIEQYHQMQIQKINLGEEAPLEEGELTGKESGVTFLGLKEMYENDFFGQDQVVGIGDTGLDLGKNDDTLHPDVRGRLIDAQILGFFNDTWADVNGHGTHVTGSVLGDGTASNGMIHGAATKASLVFQSLWTGFGGLYVPPELADLFGPTYEKGARVHSNSWGSPQELGEYSSQARSLDDYVFQHPDFLPVFAAGNEGIDKNSDGVVDEGSLLAPGTAKNALTVGASEGEVSNGGIQKTWGQTRIAANWPVEPIKSDHVSNNANGIAAFSSRGPTLDKRIKPDVVAPGTNVLSLRSRHPDSDPLWGAWNELYTFSGGTSMATPLTSGSVLVLRQYLMKVLETDSVSSALLKAAIINSARDLYPGQFDGEIKEIPVTRPNMHEGWGRVDLDSLLHQAVSYVDNKKGLKTGSNYNRTFYVNAGQSLHVTLVYSDAAGTLSAAKALVNDLDISVVGPEGTTYYPNHLTEADRVNNVEGIDIQEPAEGKYVVNVKGYQVPKGPQPFALVVSGDITTRSR